MIYEPLTKHNAKKKTNSEKHNAKFEGHNAEFF